MGTLSDRGEVAATPERRALCTLPSTEEEGQHTLALEPMQFSAEAARPAQLTALPTGLPDRYEPLQLIGRGGSCVVLLVRDLQLDRIVAMKVLRDDLGPSTDTVRARFVTEARITARLPHPGVVPIYEQGTLDDGRAWFTMKLVKGRTFSELIRILHSAPNIGAWPTLLDEWSFRRVVDAFGRICDTVAYAHSVGVVHRDLKPSNFMLGEWGEAQVMDWGLAKEIDHHDGLIKSILRAPLTEEGTTTDLSGQLPTRARGPAESAAGSTSTRYGTVLGTPPYMAPESALGESDRVGPRTDVYGLGAVLYELLTGEPPFRGPSRAVLQSLRQGERPARLGSLTDDPRVPEELAAACVRAMAPHPTARFASAADLSRAIRDWLDGSARATRALELVREARASQIDAARHLAEADKLRRHARALLAGLRSYDEVERKEVGWRAEDQAEVLALRAAEAHAEMLQKAQAALFLKDDLVEAHALLADHAAAELLRAEARGDLGAALVAERSLKVHDRGEHTALLRGDAEISLQADAPGATARLIRLSLVHHRWTEAEAEPPIALPLAGLPLRPGAYVVEVAAPGQATARLPLRLARSEVWRLRGPGEAQDSPLRMLPEADLPPTQRYIPPGWFVAGGDTLAIDSLPRREVWLDGYVMDRDPVSNADWLDFLNSLVAAGEHARAAELVPRLPAAEGGSNEWPRGADGRYALPPHSADAPVWWRPRAPVVRVSWEMAQAYCAWSAERDGLPWRLPHELEWEKAARGVDARAFPWGERTDGTWSCTAASHASRADIAEIGAYKVDVSVYGLRDLGGNSQDWCANRWTGEAIDLGPDGRLFAEAVGPSCPPQDVDAQHDRVIRGGAWTLVSEHSRCASRFAARPGTWWSSVGLRRARSV